MPKQKTNRSVAKRFPKLGRTTVGRRKAGKSHLLTSKSRKRKRQMRKGALVHSTDLKALRRLIPYN